MESVLVKPPFHFSPSTSTGKKENNLSVKITAHMKRMTVPRSPSLTGSSYSLSSSTPDVSLIDFDIPTDHTDSSFLNKSTEVTQNVHENRMCSISSPIHMYTIIIIIYFVQAFC